MTDPTPVWRDTVTDEDLITAPDDPRDAEDYIGDLLGGLAGGLVGELVEDLVEDLLEDRDGDG